MARRCSPDSSRCSRPDISPTAFLERHAGLSGGAAAGLVGGLILVGAVAGTIVGGRLSDQLRDRVAGAPMLVAAVTQAIGAVVLMPVFFQIPLAARVALSGIGVLFIVTGFPALAAMVAEVVPAAIRGIAFSVTGFLSALAAALSPLLIGAISDRFDYQFDGQDRGQSRARVRNRDAARTRRRGCRVARPAFRRGRQGPRPGDALGGGAGFSGRRRRA
ncbi:MAG: hypothetical protein QOG50_2894 [Actinomycetota bacterium]|nr:hypothetical protein [Actinomycetota bacterium]